MQINLVFSPYTWPYPPLGIASLKSYIEKQGVDQVTCYDLNQRWHIDVINGIKAGDFNIKRNQQELFLAAADLFQSDSELFYDQRIYDSSANHILNIFSTLYSLFHNQCRKALLGKGAIPIFVEKYVEDILLNKPDVVGFSVLMEKQHYFSGLIAQLIHKRNKEIPVIFGGSDSVFNHKDLLNFLGTNTFVSLSEGEGTLSQFVTQLRGDQNYHLIPNFAFKTNGTIKANRGGPALDMDQLPFPDFSDFDLAKYFSPKPVIPILSSRGCYWKRCKFCTHYEMYAGSYRKASIDRVVDEIEHRLKNGYSHFSFVDEMIPARRFESIGLEILKRDLKINYYTLAKPTLDFKPHILETMAKSGCRYILWGVESGSQRILDLIDKGTRVEDISIVLKESTLAGIMNHIYIIIGFPSETESELRKTIEFIYQNKECIHQVHYSTFHLNVNSEIYKNPEQFGLSEVSAGPEGTSYKVTKGISQAEAIKHTRYFAEHVFNQFSYFSHMLMRLRSHALIMYSNPHKLQFTATKKINPTTF